MAPMLQGEGESGSEGGVASSWRTAGKSELVLTRKGMIPCLLYSKILLLFIGLGTNGITPTYIYLYYIVR